VTSIAAWVTLEALAGRRVPPHTQEPMAHTYLHSEDDWALDIEGLAGNRVTSRVVEPGAGCVEKLQTRGTEICCGALEIETSAAGSRRLEVSAGLA
jgi:hypothetical protein